MQRGEGLTTIIKILTTEAGPVTVRHLTETTGMKRQTLRKWETKLKRTGLIKINYGRGRKKLKTMELSDLGREVLPQFVYELQTNADHPRHPKEDVVCSSSGPETGGQAREGDARSESQARARNQERTLR
jgi:hypothetical protein